MSNLVIQTPESKHIAGFEYNKEKQILRVSFIRGNHTYDFYKVPEDVVSNLQSAMSKSKYFNNNIKNKYTYVRVQ